MSDPRWGSAWRDPLPAGEGEVLQIIDNPCDELPYPVPMTIAFTRSERGGYANADARALIDWSCGAHKGRMRCDWRGQGAIVASRIRVSLETFRPNADLTYSAAPVSATLGGRPSYACTVGIGAVSPRLPLTFTTAYGNTDTFQPPQAFSKRVRVLGYNKPEPTVLARLSHTTDTATSETYAPDLTPLAAAPGDLLVGLVAHGTSAAHATGFAGWNPLQTGTWPQSRVVWKVAAGGDTIAATNAPNGPVHWRSRWWRIQGAGASPVVSATAEYRTTAPPWTRSLFLAGGPTLPNHRNLWINAVAISNWSNGIPTGPGAGWTDFEVFGSPTSPGLATAERMEAVDTMDPDDFPWSYFYACRPYIIGVRAQPVPLTPTEAQQYSSFPVVNNGATLGHYDRRAMMAQSHPLHPLPDRVVRAGALWGPTGFYVPTPQYVAVQYELGC